VFRKRRDFSKPAELTSAYQAGLCTSKIAGGEFTVLVQKLNDPPYSFLSFNSQYINLGFSYMAKFYTHFTVESGEVYEVL
jgi:hypothetical protein